MIVTTDMTNSVAVLTVNNPPVNMGNTALRRALAESLDEVATRDDVVGVVIASAASHFYAGSDISEFDRPLQAPQLPEVIARIENLDVPVVAALTGLTLGGGLELALGCDLRIGDPTTVVGFPETTLGILPGAGGTVRTARLVGVAPTIDLVASARRIDADEASRSVSSTRLFPPISSSPALWNEQPPSPPRNVSSTCPHLRPIRPQRKPHVREGASGRVRMCSPPSTWCVPECHSTGERRYGRNVRSSTSYG